MRKEHKGVIAVLCSDIHLCHKAPVARSVEKDWYAVMERSLDELDAVAGTYDVPIICAGDIFDHWKSPPELINFAIDNLPKMFAIPGQHDLPYHSLEDIKKSAYWTLVQSGVIQNIPYKSPFHVNAELRVWGFPWGCDVELKEDDTGPQDIISISKKGPVSLAVVHAYNWSKGHNYPGAPKEAGVIRWQKKLSRFDASVFGDNHKGFTFGHHMMNCGTFMRRKIDEMDYVPQIGLLTKWGKIIPYQMVASELDQFIDREELIQLAEKGMEMQSFLAELAKLGDTGLNFLESVKRFCTKNGVDHQVEKIILEALEKK